MSFHRVGWPGDVLHLALISVVLFALSALASRGPAQEPQRLSIGMSTAEVQRAQREWARHMGSEVEEKIDLGGGVVMTVVLVPPGKFRMGSPKEEEDRSPEEEQHDVEISKPFFIGKYEVTQEQYQRITGKNPSWFSSGGTYQERVVGMDTARHPVENISWTDAGAFCGELAKLPALRRVGASCRLPTEAEWEYACRACSTTIFHFGDRLNGTEANCDGTVPYGTELKGPYLERTTRVGIYPANALGLHDLHGNVWEWCQDWYDEGYYKKSASRDPVNDDKATDRVMRGGSWIRSAGVCRAAVRMWVSPEGGSGAIGLRLVVSDATKAP